MISVWGAYATYAVAKFVPLVHSSLYSGLTFWGSDSTLAWQRTGVVPIFYVGPQITTFALDVARNTISSERGGV